ncbi:hypothetical protein OV079_23830 [Nannocystis pusilla]|uniref:Uncharacterized protein n=1 Tax=Nannocystis pusilla TaxID=889268 RepID=A0A9X3EH78_9BACT|nr:hypothetical protein [Nannocystis pusilla]MCY1004009.1 hypothetical protein [Nannocystis pusilla]MCY1008533.1 hypothetical protein [Nannocystis pusilla]
MTQPPPTRRHGADNGRWRFTEDLQSELVRLIRAGNDRAEAAKRCRLGERTLKYWIAKGRSNIATVSEANEREAGAGDELLDEYGLFVLEVDAAEAACEASLKEVVFKAAIGDAQKGIAGNWKAALEILERRWPTRWSKRLRAIRAHVEDEEEREADRGGTGPTDTVASGLTNESALQIEEKLLGITRRTP